MSESRDCIVISPILLILPMLILLLNHHDTQTATPNIVTATPNIVTVPIDFSIPISNGIEYFKSFGITSLLLVVMTTGVILWKFYERRKYMWMFIVTMLSITFVWWVFGDLSLSLKPFNMLHH